MAFNLIGEQEQLLPRGSVDRHSIVNSDDCSLDDFTGQSLSWPERTLFWPRGWHTSPSYWRLLRSRGRGRSIGLWLVQGLVLGLVMTLSIITICGIFFPSYSHPPKQYTALRRRVNEAPHRRGVANVNNEKVFIAAALYDPGGDLVAGDWGQSVTSLIDILGPENVHLSIYENDADDKSKAALEIFGSSLACNSSIVVEDLDTSELAHVITPDGSNRLKRMALLAEVRNRALRPLEDGQSQASQTRFDRVLWMNDIVFDPIDAANLLFSTNVDEESGKTRYQAACAIDLYKAGIKFYDIFATRDLEGYRMGARFYPWFTSAGEGSSRADVLAQKDAVRVKSCWGGMVAFDARWYQPRWHSDPESNEPVNAEIQSPLRFRATNDTFTDASECCLIHADITAALSEELSAEGTGIFMNPYIRVAYSTATFKWLSFARRFERLYSPLHTLVNWVYRLPSRNPRRLEQPGETVNDRVWVWDDNSKAAIRNSSVDQLPKGLHGSFQDIQRVASAGSFCDVQMLQYINENPKQSEKHWNVELAPTGR